jgi:hypothetical protein
MTWSDTDKAEWILQNGNPHIAWIFERVDEKVYRRPMAPDGEQLPPWLANKPRELVTKQKQETHNG